MPSMTAVAQLALGLQRKNAISRCRLHVIETGGPELFLSFEADHLLTTPFADRATLWPEWFDRI